MEVMEVMDWLAQRFLHPLRVPFWPHMNHNQQMAGQDRWQIRCEKGRAAV